MDLNIPEASTNCTTKSNEASSIVNLQVVPNPASNEVKIKSNQLVKNLHVELVNMQGIKQLSAETNGNELLLNTSTLPQGCYFIKIMEGNKFIRMEKLLVIR